MQTKHSGIGVLCAMPYSSTSEWKGQDRETLDFEHTIQPASETDRCLGVDKFPNVWPINSIRRFNSYNSNDIF